MARGRDYDNGRLVLFAKVTGDKGWGHGKAVWECVHVEIVSCVSVLGKGEWVLNIGETAGARSAY